MKWGKPELFEKKEETPAQEIEKPSFEPSGKLAADTNTYKGVVIKYNEPPDAKLPKVRWRLYPFKISFIFKNGNKNVFIIGQGEKKGIKISSSEIKWCF